MIYSIYASKDKLYKVCEYCERGTVKYSTHWCDRSELREEWHFAKNFRPFLTAKQAQLELDDYADERRYRWCGQQDRPQEVDHDKG